jgi:hypothetical protein
MQMGITRSNPFNSSGGSTQQPKIQRNPRFGQSAAAAAKADFDITSGSAPDPVQSAADSDLKVEQDKLDGYRRQQEEAQNQAAEAAAAQSLRFTALA